MKRWSLRRRLTAQVAALVAVTLAALALIVLAVVERAAWRQFDGGLAERALAWSALVEHDEDGYEMELPPPSPAARATYAEVWCPDDTVLARSASLGDRDLPRPGGERPLALTLPDGRRGRALALRFVPRDEAGGAPAPCRLVLAEGTEDVTAAIARIRRWLLATGALALVAAIAVTWLLAARVTRPLRELASELDGVDDATLARRLVVHSPPRELEPAIDTLHRLLARLDAAFARERRFTADVGHELRTPLAGLRTLLEVTTLTASTADEHRAAIARALTIIGELTRLVERLLALARAEGGLLRPARAPVALRALIDDLWAPHAGAAAARGLELRNRIADDVEVATDRDLAAVVLGNLLANAAAYTEAGGWIEVSGDGATIDVVDSGPPIPPAELARVFDRLWRGDAARGAEGGHAGIGLALALAVARTLGWSLAASSGPGGAVVFRIRTRLDEPTGGALA